MVAKDESSLCIAQPGVWGLRGSAWMAAESAFVLYGKDTLNCINDDTSCHLI